MAQYSTRRFHIHSTHCEVNKKAYDTNFFPPSSSLVLTALPSRDGDFIQISVLAVDLLPRAHVDAHVGCALRPPHRSSLELTLVHQSTLL